MSEFTDYLHELFSEFGPIRTRKMFGGYGVFHNGVMFALVADDTLYLKANAETAPAFQALGLPQFEYTRNNKRVQMSYYMAPAETLEDPEEMADWARLAYTVASTNS